jgi:hypothetical protein
MTNIWLIGICIERKDPECLLKVWDEDLAEFNDLEHHYKVLANLWLKDHNEEYYNTKLLQSDFIKDIKYNDYGKIEHPEYAEKAIKFWDFVCEKLELSENDKVIRLIILKPYIE